MRIDAHHHFWIYNQERDTWISEDMSVLKADFLPDDLHIEMKKNNIHGCVSVQAGQSEEETFFLNDLAQKHEWILGVVGWVDFLSTTVQERLEFFSSFEKIKGWRHIIQSEKKGFMETPEFLRGIKNLSAFDFTFDLLLYPHQLKEAIELVRRFPEQKFVIDHMAKPRIKDGEIREWATGIQAMSEFPNVWCKVSGLVTEANWHQWQPQNFKPYLDKIVACFGTQRLIYGSDWPVCLLASSYRTQLQLVEDYFSSFSSAERDSIFGRNAEKFYALRT